LLRPGVEVYGLGKLGLALCMSLSVVRSLKKAELSAEAGSIQGGTLRDFTFINPLMCTTITQFGSVSGLGLES